GGRVPVSTGGGGEPLWSHDGHRLFYRAGAAVLAATVVTSPTLQISDRATLFTAPFVTDVYHPNYDVASDGQTFVMVRPVETDRDIVLVVNWLQELRQRTRGAK
ncbi:MAG: hypothetical protein ABJC19_12325, partial [Gemmatimonadota bacterium]